MKWKRFSRSEIVKKLLNDDSLTDLDLKSEYQKLNTDSDKGVGKGKYEYKDFIYQRVLKAKTDSSKKDSHSKFYWHRGNYPDGGNLPTGLVVRHNELKEKDSSEFYNYFQHCPGINKFLNRGEIIMNGEPEVEPSADSDVDTQTNTENYKVEIEEKYKKQFEQGLILFKGDRQKASAFAYGLMPSKNIIKAIQSEIETFVNKCTNDKFIDGADLLQSVKNNITPSNNIVTALKTIYPNGIETCKTDDNKEACERWSPVGKYARMPEVLRRIVKSADYNSESQVNLIGNLANKIVKNGGVGFAGKSIKEDDIKIAKDLLLRDKVEGKEVSYVGNEDAINIAISIYERSVKEANKRKKGKVMTNALGVKGDSVVIRDKDDV